LGQKEARSDAVKQFCGGKEATSRERRGNWFRRNNSRDPVVQIQSRGLLENLGLHEEEKE